MMTRMAIIRESVKIVSDLKLLSDSPTCQTNKSDHERSFFVVGVSIIITRRRCGHLSGKNSHV